MSNAYVGVGINSSSNNTVANSTITSNNSNALFLANANNSNIFNNTFISTVQNQQLVVMSTSPPTTCSHWTTSPRHQLPT